MKRVLVAAMIFISLSASAQQERKYGDWSTDHSVQGFQIASTSNSSGSTTGIICNLENEACDAFIAMGIGCENEAKYPLMLNSPIGATYASSKCLHIGKMQILVVAEFGSMVNAFEGGGEIGFAVPMQSGQFRVSRFSTTGATPAIKDAKTLPSTNKYKKTKLGDQSL